jgi:tetraacyldisaccharide-1-P 4'-kinase
LADALTQAEPSAVLLTTEKDVVKFENINLPLFYLPVQPYFLSAEDQFQALIAQRLRDYAGA